MTLHKYLSFMAAATMACWFSWLYSIWSIDPEATNWIGFAIFYVSIYLSIVGTAAIFGFLVRFVILKRDLAFRSVKDAFRQSFLFAILIVTSLILLSHNLFTWLNLLLLISGVSVLEIFLLNDKKEGMGKLEIRN